MRKTLTGALLGACFSLAICLILAVPAQAAAVALTFDDGPGPLTAELLEILREEDVPATFFLCGYRLEQFPEAAALLAETNHELGVHGYSHTAMSKLSGEALWEELDKTRALILETTGREPALLRPPGGLCSPAVRTAAEEQGWPVVLWSVDPEDWRPGVSGRTVERRVTEQAADGAVILLHDLNRRTLDALPGMIRTLKERGFEFVTVSALAERQGTHLEPGVCYRSFPPVRDSQNREPVIYWRK